MGSGRCGRYANTYGAKRNCSHEHISEGSQPYAETYHVEPKMLEKDKANPDIYNETKGYFKNPTSNLLESAIDGNRFVYNKGRVENKRMYILDKDGNIFFGKRCNPNNSKGRSPHPTLIGGKDPIVQCAGIIDFYKGRIKSIDNNSGHYKPNIKFMEKVYAILKELYKKNPNLFDKNFKWR